MLLKMRPSHYFAMKTLKMLLSYLIDREHLFHPEGKVIYKNLQSLI